MNEFSKILAEERDIARSEWARLHADEEDGGAPIEPPSKLLAIPVGELGIITTATVSIIGRSANLALDSFKSNHPRRRRTQRNAFLD